jgi:hypothetical protein
MDADLKGFQEAVRKAELATADVKDKDLRRAAFERVLDQLLGSAPRHVEASKPGGTGGKIRHRPTAERTKSGPTSHLKDLVGEGFFAKPRTSSAILEKLGEEGRQLRLSDITVQLQQLARAKMLRRRKTTIGKGTRKVWEYSNW